jgi:hypothetical protein
MTLCELKGEKCIGDRGRDKVFRWTDDSFLIGIARAWYLSGSYLGDGVLRGVEFLTAAFFSVSTATIPAPPVTQIEIKLEIVGLDRVGSRRKSNGGKRGGSRVHLFISNLYSI